MLSEASGRVAGRVRDEVLEEVGTSKEGKAPSLAAAAESAKPRHGFAVRTLLKLTGGEDDSGVKAYAEERGMDVTEPAAFHSAHITLPLPGTVTDVASGTLPGTERRGHVAWIEFASDVDVQRDYLAAVGELERDVSSAWIDEEDIGVPGFDTDLPKAALEAARAAGYGVSTGGRSACVYTRTSGHTPKAEADAFAARAAEVLALIEAG